MRAGRWRVIDAPAGNHSRAILNLVHAQVKVDYKTEVRILYFKITGIAILGLENTCTGVFLEIGTVFGLVRIPVLFVPNKRP